MKSQRQLLLRHWGWLLVILPHLSSHLPLCFARDTITPSQPLALNQTLVSTGGSFVLGLFTPDETSTTKTYLGIWFGKVSLRTVAWVANRDTPIPNSTGISLMVGAEEGLVLLDDKGAVLWSSGEKINATNPVAQLLDSGNLVLTETRSDGATLVLWQSFDYPSDTMLAGMKIGWDLRTGLNRQLTSWAASGDPSPGRYRYAFDLRGVPQLYTWWQQSSTAGATATARYGFWNGLTFSNRPSAVGVFEFEYVADRDEVYYVYQVEDNSTISRFILDYTGRAYRYIWEERTGTWTVYWEYPGDQCDGYNVCGAYAVCNTDVTTCDCLPGYGNSRPGRPNIRDGTDRCARRTPVGCGEGDGFRKVSGLKLPDTSNATMDKSKSLDECREMCLANCSCTAYSLADIKVGTGCVMWFGDLVDVKQFAQGGLDLYLRLAGSELQDTTTKTSTKKKQVMAITISTVAVTMLLLLLFIGYAILKKKKKQGMININLLHSDRSAGEEVQLPIFSLETMTAATDNFSVVNKLGEGGFGQVYWGQLKGGEEIAVKRLSEESLQGRKEFMNEITLIAKLQHRNLVRLLGCCMEGDERMLIYEYMPNRSLNSFIFDEQKGRLLDWKMRIEIVKGIARGVLYLHHDSRLKIVHRDLKTSNILLDEQMNPRISDFGTARIMANNQIKDNTRIVVGTYGYMPPEYVMHGIYSMKSDVFSFGVIVLEIMSGIKNKVVFQEELSYSLQGYAWNLWNEGNISYLTDKKMGLPCLNFEVRRCLHVALLCVQESTDDRPPMSSVVLMLSSDAMELPQPKKPGFFTTVSSNEASTSSSGCKLSTNADVTLTQVGGR